jgi:hypothetical protein
VSLRVVVLAEGVGETGGELSLRPAPRGELHELHFGAAHFLVRRSIAKARSIAEPAVHFEEPLRKRNGVIAKGSDLTDRTLLRQLLSWGSKRPDLAIVLVDADEDKQRKQLLKQHVEGLPATIVIAVAIQEFEAWLVADHESSGQPTPPAVESMKRGEAKTLLTKWLKSSDDAKAARRELAQKCDLERMEKRAPSFAQFLSDLSA